MSFVANLQSRLKAEPLTDPPNAVFRISLDVFVGGNTSRGVSVPLGRAAYCEYTHAMVCLLLPLQG
jgi:hypothetical protein